MKGKSIKKALDNLMIGTMGSLERESIPPLVNMHQYGFYSEALRFGPFGLNGTTSPLTTLGGMWKEFFNIFGIDFLTILGLHGESLERKTWISKQIWIKGLSKINIYLGVFLHNRDMHIAQQCMIIDMKEETRRIWWKSQLYRCLQIIW